jgi:hypothetical protein
MSLKNGTQNVTVGPGLVTVLTGIFVAGKIFGYLSWSWWWVLSPIWISWGVVLGILGVVGIFALIARL